MAAFVRLQEASESEIARLRKQLESPTGALTIMIAARDKAEAECERLRADLEQAQADIEAHFEMRQRFEAEFYKAGNRAETAEAALRSCRAAALREALDAWVAWKRGLPEGAFTHADGMRFVQAIEALRQTDGLTGSDPRSPGEEQE